MMNQAIKTAALDPLAWAALADEREERGEDPTHAREVSECLADRRPIHPNYVKWIKQALRYRGRKCGVERTDTVRAWDVRWDGGTLNRFHPVQIRDTGLKLCPPLMPEEGAVIEVRPGTMIVEESRFQGRDVGLTIHVHPADLPTLMRVAR